MYTARLINKEVQRSPSFDSIIGEFLSGMHFMRSHTQVEDHLIKFLSVFTELGGGFAIAGNVLKEDWIKLVRTECGLELQLTIG